LVAASVTNEFSKGATIDSPAMQRPVPNDDPAIESSLQPHIPMIIAYIWQLIVVLTFERSIKMQPIFQLIDMSFPNKNDLCIAFGMLTFPSVASTSIVDFHFIVNLFLNQYWEGVE
jgi:hypothetical protein